MQTGYLAQFQAAQAAKKTEPVSPAWKTFEKPEDFVCGILLGSSDVQSSLGSGTYKQYLMRTDEGLIKFSLGAATDRELLPLLHEGKLYLITYLGPVKIKGGKRVNRFAVETLNAEVEEAEAVTDRDVPF